MRGEIEVSQQQQITVHGVWHVAWQRRLWLIWAHSAAKVVNRCSAVTALWNHNVIAGAQCNTSYTEHRPPSNHQPVARVFTASAVYPISCTQLLTANSRRRQYTYTRSTVSASRRTRDEALLSLAVLKMTGKWFGRRTRVGAL